MDELVRLVARKAAITEAQAADAVAAMTAYMEEHFPEPLARQLSSLLKSKQAYLDCVERSTRR